MDRDRDRIFFFAYGATDVRANRRVMDSDRLHKACPIRERPSHESPLIGMRCEISGVSICGDRSDEMGPLIFVKETGNDAFAKP